MKKNYNFSILFLGLSLFGSSYVNAQLHILGEQVIPSDVNNNGVVAATIVNAVNLRWTEEGGLQEIGTIGVDLLSGHALVSSDDNKIISVMTNPENEMNEISVYDNTTQTWTHLGGLVANSDASKSSAWGVSEDGTTIVGLGWINGGTGHAVKWTSENGVEDLGSTVTGSSSRANAINDDKTVIVGWQDASDGFRQGAIWKNGEQTLIFDTDNNPAGEAAAVSADGKTVVGYAGLYPYVWSEAEGYTSITHENSGPFFRGGNTGITADGNTVIGYFRSWPGGPYMGEGFVWSKENGRVNFDDYAENLGIDLQGYTIALPMAISPDGTKIVGVARSSTQGVFGFYLDLSDKLNVQDQVSKNSVKIYPNPVSDVLNISTSAKTINKLEIVNILGQKIKVIENPTNKLDVSDLTKGNYILSITIDGKTTSQKFIKK